MCDGKVEVLQGIHDPALEFCPTCGNEVRKVISRASIKIDSSVSADSAAKKGFSTFRKLEKGKYEKIAGEGPDIISQ